MKRRGFQQADQIRLKLNWLDSHCRPRFSAAARLSRTERLVSTTPLVPLAAALIAGIALADAIDPVGVRCGVLAGVCGLGILAAIASFRVAGARRLPAATLAAMLLTAGAGMMRLTAVQYRGPDHLSRLRGADRCLVTLDGTIVSPVRQDETRQAFSRIPWLSEQASFYLDAAAVNTADGPRPTRGRVRVQVRGRPENLAPGDTVRVYGWLSGVSPPANPGQFDLARYLRQRGVYDTVSVATADGVETLHTAPTAVSRLRRFWSHRAADALLDETVTDPDVRALSTALLLGRRSAIDPALMAAFQKTNLAHFISLSGMHVAILAGSLWWLLKRTQLPKRPRAVLCIGLILIYALIVPPRAPTMRAVFVSCFFFASMLLSQSVRPLNTLALAAMVLLWIQPGQLFAAGWQLSFLSVLGILVFYPILHYTLLNSLFYPCVLPLKGSFVGLQHLLYAVTQGLAVGYSAWVTIAPVLLYYFGQVNPLSPVWTVLALPAVTVILHAGFLKMALAAVLPTVSSLLGVVLNAAASLLAAMVSLLGRLEVFHLTAPQPPLTLVVILYALLAAACFVPAGRRRTVTGCRVLLAVCLAMPFVGGRVAAMLNDRLELTCLSVGHGQAVVVTAPGGKHLLFDAGSITHQDLARTTLLPCLRRHNVFALDAAWLSHGDLDHLNAVPALAAAVPIRRLYANATLLANAAGPSLEKDLCDHLQALRVRPEPVADWVSDAMSVRSLWPDAATAADASISENDRSQVLLLAYAGRRILLCGDIEAYGQAALLARHPDLTVDVMILPHHGSTRQLNPDFVERFSPSVVIASCARRGAERVYHPPAGSDRQAFNTATDGAVTVTIKADGTCSAAGFLTSKQ